MRSYQIPVATAPRLEVQFCAAGSRNCISTSFCGRGVARDRPGGYRPLGSDVVDWKPNTVPLEMLHVLTVASKTERFDVSTDPSGFYFASDAFDQFRFLCSVRCAICAEDLVKPDRRFAVGIGMLP